MEKGAIVLRDWKNVKLICSTDSKFVLKTSQNAAQDFILLRWGADAQRRIESL